MSTFQFPDITQGTPIVLSNDPRTNDRTFGWVRAVKPNAADILCVGAQGFYMRYDCWHKDDPRCKDVQCYERFAEHESGVFELTDSEKRNQQLDTQLRGLEREVERLVAKVIELEKKRS